MTNSSNDIPALYEQAFEQLLAANMQFPATMKKILDLQNDFVPLHLAMLYFEMASPKNETVQGKINALLAMSLNKAEQLVLQALVCYFDGDSMQCLYLLEMALVEDETSVLILKIAYDMCFLMGETMRMRDLVARVIALPCYANLERKIAGYVHGMYAFALQECNEYGKAQKVAKIALQVNMDDVWAIHAMVHIVEMTNQDVQSGIALLESHKQVWQDAPTGLTCHLYWHLALLCLDAGKKEQAMSIFSTHMQQAVAPPHLVDASSLLQRMQLLDMPVTLEMWQPIAKGWHSKMQDKTILWFDLHLCMSLIGAQQVEQAKTFVQEMEQSVSTSHNAILSKRLCVPLCKAMLAFAEQQFEICMEQCMRVKYQLQALGGSLVQRDLFANLFLLVAAKKSNIKLYHALVQERKAWKSKSIFCTL